MKKATKLKDFYSGSFFFMKEEIENFLKNNPNIRVTAMAMTFDTGSRRYYTLLTYEEGE